MNVLKRKKIFGTVNTLILEENKCPFRVGFIQLIPTAYTKNNKFVSSHKKNYITSQIKRVNLFLQMIM
jgi:hypothetical protein